MGKLLITNSPEWDGMLRKLFAGSGFRESAHVECNDARVTAYKKLCVDNCNFYSCGDDFVSCAGTLIYRENFGEDALRMLYEDSRTMTVTELRKNLIGSYVVAVKNGDEIRIFVDETHIGKFYYYIDGGKYILTNTFYHIEKCAKQPLHDDAFLEWLTRPFTTMSRQTPYQNVYKVCAREYFRINLDDGSCSVEECPLNDYHRKFSSREEALDALFEEAKRISALRSKFIHSHRIFLTGGLDSRLEYAMHLYNHDNVNVAYWRSSYETTVTNGTQKDWEIVSKIAQTGGGVNAELIDITEPIEESFGYDVRPKCNKYGEYAGIYSFNKKWLPILENANTEGLTLGIFGEALRTLEEIDILHKSTCSMRYMIRDIYCRFGVEKNCLHSDTLYDFIESEMQPLVDGMDTENLTHDDIFKLFTYTRFGSNVIIYNLLNMFTYSFPIFAQKSFADANFSIPYEWREGDYFSLSLTKLFCPKLLEFPFFSHNHTVVYDPETNRVKAEAEYTLRRDVRRKIVDSHPLLFKFLRRIYWTVRFIRGGEEINKQKNEQKISRISEKMIRESPIILCSKLKPIDNMQKQYAIASIAAAIKVEETLTDD